MKKRDSQGRLTKEAADIIIEMIKEGVVKGGLEAFNGELLDAVLLNEDDSDTPYKLSDEFWYTETLKLLSGAGRFSVHDIRRLALKEDRKEFKRRWKERHGETKERGAEDTELVVSEPTYPVFAKSNTSGAVFLFTGIKDGLCVKETEGNNYGWFHRRLADVTNTNHWQLLTFEEAHREIFGEDNE